MAARTGLRRRTPCWPPTARCTPGCWVSSTKSSAASSASPFPRFLKPGDRPDVPRVLCILKPGERRVCPRVSLPNLEVDELGGRAGQPGRRNQVPDDHLQNVVARRYLRIQLDGSADLTARAVRRLAERDPLRFPVHHYAPSDENARLDLQRGLLVRAGEGVENGGAKNAALAWFEDAHRRVRSRIGGSIVRRRGSTAEAQSGARQPSLRDVGDLDEASGGTDTVAGAIGHHGANLPGAWTGHLHMEGGSQAVLKAKAVLGGPQIELEFVLQQHGGTAVIAVGGHRQVHGTAVPVLGIVDEGKIVGIEVQDHVHQETIFRICRKKRGQRSEEHT